MTQDLVSITAALSDAWGRMQTMLFRPFDLKKWFVVGFTAWLAGLAQGGKGFNWNVGDWSDSDTAEMIASGSGAGARVDWPDWNHWGRWLLEHPLWFAAGALGCFLLIALFLTILWVSSRGKFMFLDNVVHDRAEVVEPWHRYRHLGNSHFGFQLAFFGIVVGIMLVVGLVVFAIATASDFAFGKPVVALGFVLGGAALFLFAIAIAYVQYFLDGFVVPLMHRYDIGVVEAWQRFGELLRRHPWALLLSGPFLLILAFAAVMLALLAGVLTCCIGLILIILPYIGTVVLLPIPVTYRAFTVALLDQMDPGYFPDAVPGPGAAPAIA